MFYIYTILFAYFLLNISLKVISFFMYLYWEKRINIKIKTAKSLGDEKCWIIIPVYKEKKVIKKSYESFLNIIGNSKLDLHVVYVCTKRENPAYTFETLKSFKKNKNIHILNAGLDRKLTAGQMNFAIEYIDIKQKDYKLSIYNVDSRPDIQSIESNFKLLNKHRVVQQYGDYSNNLKKNSKTIKDLILLNAFFWQNSWSKLFEIRNTLWNNFFRRFSKFSYVVSHGLFLNREVLNVTGLFTEKFQNEDMELSIRIHEHNIKIQAGVGFSKSDMALNISDYIKQQTAWARGPMLALNYIENRKQIIPNIKLFFHYLYWLLEPIFMFFLILLSVLSGNIYLLSITFLLCLIYFGSALILPNMEHLSKIKKHPIKYITSCFLFFFIHSFGPILSLKNFILERIGLRKEHKFKTPKA